MSSGLTGYLLSDGRDLSNVFIGINNGALIASQNSFQSKQTFAGGIDISNSFLYSRNDGHRFDVSFNLLPPVGYMVDVSNNSDNPTNNSGVNYVVSMPIYPGMWVVSLRSTAYTTVGTYTAGAKLTLDISANPNIVYMNIPSSSSPMYIYQIPSSAAVGVGILPNALISIANVSTPTTIYGRTKLEGVSNDGNIFLRLILAITKIA